MDEIYVGSTAGQPASLVDRGRRERRAYGIVRRPAYSSSSDPHPMPYVGAAPPSCPEPAAGLSVVGDAGDVTGETGRGAVGCFAALAGAGLRTAAFRAGLRAAALRAGFRDA